MIVSKSKNPYDTSSTIVIIDFVLIFVMISCTFGAVISAFDFLVDPFILFLVWLIISLTASLLLKFIGFKGLLFLLFPLLILFLFWFRDITEATKWVVFYISNDYSTWLYVPVFFVDTEINIDQLTLFYVFAGILYIFPVVYAISIRKSVLLAVIFSAPVIFLTFVHQYSQSQPVFLIGLLAVYITILINNSVMIPDFIDKRFAVFTGFILAIAILGASYIIAPQQNFTRNRFIASLDYHIRDLAAQVGVMLTKTGVGWPYVSDDVWSFDMNNIDISEAGTRMIMDKGLLEVTVSEPGIYYLKGYSMQRFDGSSWSVNSNDHLLPGEHEANMVPFRILEAYSRGNTAFSAVNATMIINTSGDMTENIIYTPYYSPTVFRRDNSYPIIFFHADQSIPELYRHLPLEARPGFDLSEYSAAVHDRNTYLHINESTANGLRQIAADAGFDLTADRTVIASQVALYFSVFGNYTLTPLLIPEDEDFALYFLQHSKHGYCIHYATAATLMLRALNVPARFTVGFTATITENDIYQPVELTDGNAHAWVEVFYDDFGWLPLEVTPFAANDSSFYFGRPQVNAIPLPAPVVMEDMLGEGPFFLDFAEGSVESPQIEEFDFQRISVALIVGILIGVGIFAIITRRIIILFIRKKHFEQVDTNAAVIYAWGYMIRLTGPGRQYQISINIKEIALKASFSQHRLTEDERNRVIGYTRVFADDIYRQRSQPVRFIMKYIIGL